MFDDEVPLPLEVDRVVQAFDFISVLSRGITRELAESSIPQLKEEQHG